MNSELPLVLASSSPRRCELMTLLNVPLEVAHADIDETQQPDEPPFDYVRRLSEEKARAVAARREFAGRVIIAADTIVLLHGRVLGKPADEAHAREMLVQLRGTNHKVMTSVTVLHNGTGKQITDVCQSTVRLREMSAQEIDAYIATGDPMDKAAAYAIQNLEFAPAERVVGCPANVLGLPMCHVVILLRRHGVELPDSQPRACRIQYGGYYCALTEIAMPGLTEQGVLAPR